jgi:anti-sigma factor RsiW
MNPERLEALLWARIDETIDPGELAELEAHLAEGPEPREIERQITAIAAALDGMETVPPPAELRERIDGALAHATPPAARTEKPTTPTLTHSAPMLPARWFPLAASLLIGVAIGYLIHPGTARFIDRSEVTGTMLTPPARMSVVPVEIQLDGGAGTVTASRAGSDVAVDVVLADEIDLTVTVAGTFGPLSLAGITGDGTWTAEASPESRHVTVHARGPASLQLSFGSADDASPVRLQVTADGVAIAERVLDPFSTEAAP